MSVESVLVPILSGICARTFPDFTKAGTVAPYATWQAIGGRTLRYIDNAAADKRNSLIQISVWATTRAEATTLIRSIEDAVCASTSMTAEAQGEALSDHDLETNLYGAIQRFSIYAAR